MAVQTELWIVMRKNHRFFETLGERIINRRKELGLTQIQLGEMMGVTQQVIASYETARRQIPAWRVPNLAKALDLALEDMMGVNGSTRKRGPKSKLEKQLDEVRQLPRNEQVFVSQFLEKMLAKAQ